MYNTTDTDSVHDDALEKFPYKCENSMEKPAWGRGYLVVSSARATYRAEFTYLAILKHTILYVYYYT